MDSDMNDRSHVSKKRRLEGSPLQQHRFDYAWQQQQQQQQQNHQSHQQAAPTQPQGQNTESDRYQSAPMDSTDGAGAFEMQESGVCGMPYPNVSAPAQPYFTDPNTYLSSWPPMGSGTFPPTETVYPIGHHLQQNSGEYSNNNDMSLYPQASIDSNSIYHNANASSEVQTRHREKETPPPPPPPPEQQSHILSSIPTQFRHRPPNGTFNFEDISMHLKIQSLPILGNLAIQLIQTISRSSLPQLQDLMHTGESDDAQAFITLKSLFDQTRKVYSRETPFIDAIAIQMFQASQQEIIRKANIATFISSILGAHDVSFFHLNEYFMETFVPLGHRLLKWQGAIFLELKTQSYISALMNSDGSPQALLDELFPPDLDAQILTRHPDAPSLSPSEQDFIDRCRSRKSYLLQEPSTPDVAQELSRKYQWNDFVREFATSISKNVEGILNVPARTQQMFGSGTNDKRAANAVQAVHDSAFQNQAIPAQQQSHQSLPALHSGLGGQQDGTPGGSRQPGNSHGDNNKKSTSNTSAVRQPWTKAEEEALLAGLDKVSGPHWSQILALYGRGGSVSEVLKDRNQVQLKDKARNLKLWYLKTGKEVPSSLRGVTGELRKRGGARAKAALGLLDDDDENTNGEHGANDEGREQRPVQVKTKKPKKKA